MIVYLSEEQVLFLHENLMQRFDGATGVRHRGALQAAVARPGMTFGGDDLYPDLASKAAAVMHSLILNHAFVDGNKRVGACAAELMILVNGSRLTADEGDFEVVAFQLARGDLNIEALAIWFRQRISHD